MYHSKEVGFAATYSKPISRKECKSIKNYIIVYMFNLDPGSFEQKGDSFVLVRKDKYKSIFNTIIDEYEKVGYITLDRVWKIVKEMADPLYSICWFDES